MILSGDEFYEDDEIIHVMISSGRQNVQGWDKFHYATYVNSCDPVVVKTSTIGKNVKLSLLQWPNWLNCLIWPLQRKQLNPITYGGGGDIFALLPYFGYFLQKYLTKDASTLFTIWVL